MMATLAAVQLALATTKQGCGMAIKPTRAANPTAQHTKPQRLLPLSQAQPYHHATSHMGSF
jgi:hypothetical protein